MVTLTKFLTRRKWTCGWKSMACDARPAMRTQIFGVAHIMSYLSRFMPLQAGDVIATGTPSGRWPGSQAATVPEGRRSRRRPISDRVRQLLLL